MSTYGTYDLKQFLQDLCSRSIEPNQEIYGYLSRTDVPRFIRWRQRLDVVRKFKVTGTSSVAQEKRGQKAQLVGKIFEKLIRVLLDGCQAIKHDGNVRSTTSEIDFVIRVQPLGLVIPMFRENGNHSLGEAKCLLSPLKTEWINEFAGLLPTHSATLGILFTACPSKKLRAEQRTAIALQAVTGKRIVPFGLKQIAEVEKGRNFLELLSEQYTRALVHSSDLHI